MNEAQKILDESVTRLLRECVTRERLADCEVTGFDDALWATCLEQGLCQVLLSEQQGGMGGGWPEAFIVARACGRFAVPLPIPEQILASWLLAEAHLPPRDDIVGLLPQAIDAAALRGGHANFSADRVPWGRRAEYFIGATADEIVVLDRANTTIDLDANLAREPRDRVTF
ncbi:MAG: acyl-CoA dehydrogenase family protein, partial [Gammaproteobacteria bacterium]